MALITATRTRTSLPDRTKLGAVVRATVDHPSTCACGQALDAGLARSCPRCGIRVKAKVSSLPISRSLPYRAEWST